MFQSVQNNTIKASVWFSFLVLNDPHFLDFLDPHYISMYAFIFVLNLCFVDAIKDYSVCIRTGTNDLPVVFHRLFRPLPRLALPGPPALRVCLFIARQLSVSSRLHGLLTHGACLLETDQPIFRCQRQIRKRESVTCLPVL